MRAGARIYEKTLTSLSAPRYNKIMKILFHSTNAMYPVSAKAIR